MKTRILFICSVILALFGVLGLGLMTASGSTTSISIDPPQKAVANGSGAFTVNLTINTSEALISWQANLSFDASKLQADTVGSSCLFLSGHGGSVASGGDPKIDNTNGRIIGINFALLGGTSAATGTGVLNTITFHPVAQNYAVVLNFVPVMTYTIGDGSQRTSATEFDTADYPIASLTFNNGTVVIGTAATNTTLQSSTNPSSTG